MIVQLSCVIEIISIIYIFRVSGLSQNKNLRVAVKRREKTMTFERDKEREGKEERTVASKRVQHQVGNTLGEEEKKEV